MSGLNCPLCQIGDNKQFEALSCHCLSPPAAAPAFSEAAARTLKLDVSVREVNLCCDGVANIMAGFIDTDCSDTSKSGPINLHTDGGVTGGVRAPRLYGRVTNVCLTSFTRDMVTLTEKWRRNQAVSSKSGSASRGLVHNYVFLFHSRLLNSTFCTFSHNFIPRS